MTRELALQHAKKELINTLPYETMVNTLFDQFENRVCINCKYGEYEKNLKAIYCPFVSYLGSDYVEKDFGCNKFEEK